MKAALYARVSTRLRKEVEDGREPEWKQDPEVQLAPLRQLLSDRGWESAGEYIDRESGAKEDRAELSRLFRDARRNQFRAVVVWRFDRFARSVRQLTMALDEFRALGIDFISLTESIDTTTVMGRAMFGVAAVFAELEREVTRERIKAGLQRRVAKGLPIGRRPSVFRRDIAKELRAQGLSWSKIAIQVGASVPVVRRAVLGIDRRPHRAHVGPAQNPSRQGV